MKLSKQTQKELQTFFREYFDDKTLKLPKIEVYSNGGAKLVTMIAGADGITFGRHIFIKPKSVKLNQNNNLRMSKNLLAHEVTHVLQYQKLGFFGFLFVYLKDYFLGLKRKKKWNLYARIEAYWEIPSEVEARDAAEKFEEWLEQKGKSNT